MENHSDWVQGHLSSSLATAINSLVISLSPLISLDCCSKIGVFASSMLDHIGTS